MTLTLTLTLYLCFFAYIVFGQTSDVIYSLEGNDWNVSNATSRYPATVPGSIYIDLMNAGVLGDPYYGTKYVFFFFPIFKVVHSFIYYSVPMTINGLQQIIILGSIQKHLLYLQI